MLRQIGRAASIMLASLLFSGCGGDSGQQPVGCGGHCPAKSPYLAIAATPTAHADNGPTDLYVVPVDTPDVSPTHVATYGWMLDVAAVRAGNGDGVEVRHFYTTIHETNGDHLWSLDLTGASSLTPVQVSNVTFPFVPDGGSLPGYPGGREICSTQVIMGRILDPDSAVLLLSLPDANTVCEGKPGQTLLVHINDSATTAPTTVALGSGTVLTLYKATGELAGIVAVDDTQNLNLYADTTFTHPTQLLSNVTSMTAWQEPSTPQGNFAAAHSYAYLVVKSTTSVGAGSVYRIDSTGAFSDDLYDFQSPVGNQATPLVKDDIVYFVDSVPLESQTVSRVNVISHGTAAQTLATFNQQQSLGPFLAGPAGQQLIIQGRASSQSPWLVQTLPVGSGPGVPTTILSTNAIAGTAVSGTNLLVNYQDITGPSLTYSSQILDNSGAILRATLPGSAFLSITPTVLLSTNMPTGGDLEVVNLSQPAGNGVALKTYAGATFTFPANIIPAVHPISATRGTLEIDTAPATSQNWFYDTTTGLVTPLTVPNANVTVW
jgi:hypothetical protein